MPKPTFYNLKNDKKEKIEKAIKEEFSRTSYEETSISNIIEKAQIPRGSFYQYFEDKEDAVKYIIHKYIEEEKAIIKNILINKKGNIFEASIDIFDYIIKEVEEGKDVKLYKNILENLRKNNVSIFEEGERPKNKLINILDTEILNIEEEKDIIYMMKIISTILRVVILEVISGKLTKEYGRQKLIKEIEILKRGMLKKN